MPRDNQFALAIALFREERGLSQKELSTLVGVSPQYLNDVERNRRNPPSDTLIESLATVLQVSRDWLFFAAGRMPPDLQGEVVPAETVEAAMALLRQAVRRIGCEHHAA